MNKYYAFEYEVSGTPTYGIFPLSRECSLQMGYYNAFSGELVVQSKDTVENLKFVEKTDAYRGQVVSKGKTEYEKRTINEKLTFRLLGEDKDAFIKEFVHNPDVITLVLSKIDELVAKQKEEADKKAAELELAGVPAELADTDTAEINNDLLEPEATRTFPA